MKHTFILHLVHNEPSHTDTTKKKKKSGITHYFVFLALPSLSFVMTAAKSPHHSNLFSLPRFIYFFAFCTHPFIHTLLHWQALKNLPSTLARMLAVIFSTLPQNQADTDLSLPVPACILSVTPSLSHQIYPVTLFSLKSAEKTGLITLPLSYINMLSSYRSCNCL